MSEPRETHETAASTSALYEDGTTIYFNDLVHEGEAVDVFRTEREAQTGVGWARRMRVRRGGDVWWLEAESNV